MSIPAPNKMLPIKPLTILHTSDWHLGRRLYGRMRYDEFEAFLAWLKETISLQKVDILIVAGDIFDTMTPSNRAQALYYEFLSHVSQLCCQHVVIVAGNHDSPTFLDAPRQVLKSLNVHVIGTACEDLNDEVFVLDDTNGMPQCIIAAVPYLRDRDVRSSSAGESADSKDANVIKGIRAHYDGVAEIARAKQAELAKIHQCQIPIIATGHLFAAGSKTTEDDGVRDLYVGNLGQISADMFDDGFDYVALGHLHVPQRVGGREHIRYSGSPIAMGFGEAKQQKQVLLVKFGAVENGFKDKISTAFTEHPLQTTKQVTKKAAAQTTEFMDDLFGFSDSVEPEAMTPNSIDKESFNQTDAIHHTHSTSNVTSSLTSQLLHHDESRQMQVVSLPIPCFQKLAQITGDLTTIATAIKSLNPSEPIWLEVVYDGDEIVNELREEVNAMIEGLNCEVLLTKNPRNYNKVLNQQQSSETLQDLNELDVFDKCLEINGIAGTQKASLRSAYEQILHNIYHDDAQAE